MWSDTLFAAERLHLLRLALWAAASTLTGTVIVAVIAFRRTQAPIVSYFAMQTLAWGIIELAVVAAMWRGLSMRDVSGATRLDRLTWFNAGLDLGIVGIGVGLAIAGWLAGRRLRLIGSGLGVVVQGLALLVINLTFTSALARLV